MGSLPLDDNTQDVTLFNQKFSDAALHSGSGNRNLFMIRRAGVTNPGEHVCDGISDHLSLLPRTLFDTGNLTQTGKPTETDATKAELAHVSARTATHRTAAVFLRAESRRP